MFVCVFCDVSVTYVPACTEVEREKRNREEGLVSSLSNVLTGERALDLVAMTTRRCAVLWNCFPADRESDDRFQRTKRRMAFWRR